MKSLNKSIGNYGETLAKTYIETLGYISIEQNFSCKLGEIDLIAKDSNYICFIEVKTRYATRYGYPLESITSKKIKKLYRAAQYYISLNNIHKSFFRFDAIEIIINANDSSHRINLIKNAF
ncbi:MAG: YraN family protein [Clostridium sp.]|uniref:YraN family protein n=1 Tax=Clostridium sp. TaxID=1506 RepID=UPI0030205ECD